MAMPIETPLFFPGRAAQLFGVLHEPVAADDRLAFVLCHPFGEEKLWAHRVFVHAARMLARRGHAVLRFDCSGHGDSDGDDADTSLQSHLVDIAAAVDFLKTRRQVASVGLLGLRLGATEAALLGDQRTDISQLVLWSPITDGAKYMQELLRINLATQLAVYGSVTSDRENLVAQMRAGQTVNIDGYELSLPFYDQLSAVALTRSPRTFAGRCLIVQIDRSSDAQPARDLDQLRHVYQNATLAIVAEEPFWKEIKRFYERTEQLVATTLDWLERS